MLRPIEVKTLPNYRLWLRYADGVAGEVDLSGLVGKGVFEAWENPSFFAQVHLGDHGEVMWGEDIDLCPDSLYMQITGKSPKDLFPSLRYA